MGLGTASSHHSLSSVQEEVPPDRPAGWLEGLLNDPPTGSTQRYAFDNSDLVNQYLVNAVQDTERLTIIQAPALIDDWVRASIPQQYTRLILSQTQLLVTARLISPSFPPSG